LDCARGRVYGGVTMTWEIFLGIVALVGFVGSIGLWIFKLSKILAVLETTVSSLTEAIKEFKEDSKTEHKEMKAQINDHDKQLVDHDKRLEILETYADIQH
jgi:hypothetical protein